MKQFFQCCLFFLIISQSSLFCLEKFIEARVEYYCLSNHTSKKLLGNTKQWGLEGSIEVWKYLYPWIGINYMSLSGHSIGPSAEGTRTPIKLDVVPLTFGVRRVFPIFSQMSTYVGVGAVLAFIDSTEESSLIVRKREKNTWGTVFKAGAFIGLSRGVYLDIFSEFTYLTMRYRNTSRTVGRSASLSGLGVGGGFGYVF